MAESKVTTLTDALRKTQSFIQATEIWTGDEPQQQENRKRSGEDCDVHPNKHPKRNEERGAFPHKPLQYPYGNQGKSNAQMTQAHRNSGQLLKQEQIL